MKNILTILIASFLIISCDKSDEKFHKMAGVYDIYKYEAEYFTNGIKDSIIEKKDIGTIALFDNAHYQYNLIETKFNYTPKIWRNYGIGLDAYWFIDEFEGKTLTFWDPQYIGSNYVIYTREKTFGNKEKWIAVIPDADGRIKLKETVYVKKR